MHLSHLKATLTRQEAALRFVTASERSEGLAAEEEVANHSLQPAS